MYKINEQNITIVIQGKVCIENGENKTENLINQILYFHPNVNIVLSCWEGDLIKITSKRLVVIYNSDPGENDTVNKYLRNLNRMIVSTSNGIHHCKTSYVAKVRSDFYLIKPFDFNLLFKKTCNGKKVLTCMSYGHYRLFPFYISDWFHFGNKENMKKMWSSALLNEKPNLVLDNKKGVFYSQISEKVDHIFNSEQYIGFNFLLNNSYKLTYDYYRISIYDIFLSYLRLGNHISVISRYDIPLRSDKHKIYNNQKDLFIWSDFCSDQNIKKFSGLIKLAIYYFYMRFIK